MTQLQDAKKFDENIVLLEDNNKGPSDSPYDTILKPLFISPDLIQIPMEDPKNEQVISPTNTPDNPTGSLSDLQKLFEYTKTLVNDNDVLVINDAAASPASLMRDAAEANVRNFSNFEGENEIDQMAVESAADRNMTTTMGMDTVAAESSRIERSGVVEAETMNTGEDSNNEAEEDDDEREGAESKVRYSRFRKVTPIVVKAAEDDCDEEEEEEPQQLIKVSPTRDYLPSKVNVEIVDDHNNGQFLKETTFIAAPPKTDEEIAFSRPTVTTKYQTIVNTTPIPIGLRLTPPKTNDEDCDDPPHFKGKTIVEVQKSVSVTERRVANNPVRGPSRFVTPPPTSKCLNDCSTPHTPIFIPARPQQIVVEKPVVIDRIVDRPVPVHVEKIVNRPYPVDRIVEKPVTIVKSVQVPVPVDRIVEKPVQVTKYVDRPYPVERIVEKPVPYPVERVVEKLVPQPYPVEKQVPVTVERIVDRPVDRIVEKFIDRPYPVEKIVERPVEVPVTQIVEKIVDRPVEVERIVEKEVPVPYPVEVNKYIDRPYPVEKIVERPVHIPVPYETVVEKIVDRPVEVETIVETPVEVPVPVAVPQHFYHHLHHVHNPHPHEHHLHSHSHSPSSHVVKHVHLDQLPVSLSHQPLPHFDFSKTAEDATTTLLKPVHKLLGNLWNKLQTPFFGHGNHHGHHHGHQTKHVVPLYKTKYHQNDNHLYAGE